MLQRLHAKLKFPRINSKASLFPLQSITLLGAKTLIENENVKFNKKRIGNRTNTTGLCSPCEF